MSHRLPSSLNIISWNVASWTTTASNIAKYHGSVSNWLDRHHVDILCLQEVKATRQKILSSPVCHLNPAHWDMFLSPCVSRPGLNGVATLVRKNRIRPSGTGPSIPTIGADSRPFSVQDLDDQGRCILTDHGAFTLINVYVPYDGEKGVQIPLKLKFLDNLRRLIKQIQASGRPVICVGDFNVARDPRDVHYEFRKIDLANLVKSGFESAIALIESRRLPSELLNLLNFLRSNYDSIESVLSNRQVTEFNTSSNGAKFGLKLSNGTKSVYIGQRQASASACDAIANLQPLLTVDGYVYKPAGTISIGDLFEVMAKLLGADFPEQTIMTFSDLFGMPRSAPPVIEKYDQLIAECRLVDTYIKSNPAGRLVSSERFTCWDQYRNDRYENKGARIDYIFVDSTIEDSIRLSEGGSYPNMSPLSVSSDRSIALRACTADQSWRPVPFAGGGIDASDPPSIGAKNFEFQFTNPPQTGIVYTPPLFSDHVATSLVVDMSALPAAATTGINERMNDELGTKWKASLSDALVAIASKSHSLKDMFMRQSAAAAAAAEQQTVVVIELDDSEPSSPERRDECAVKKSRVADSGN